MKSAKEMFEELGYEWKETKDYVEYTKYYYKHWIFKSKCMFRFYKTPINSFDIFDEFGISIHRDLLQAINKQVEELWGGNNA